VSALISIDHHPITPPLDSSDAAASDAILHAIGDLARYVHDDGKGQWYGFDRTLGHWRPLSDGEMLAVARAIGKTSARAMKSAITAAQGETALHASIHEFDTKPHLFNVTNGTIDLAPPADEVDTGDGVTFLAEPWHWEARPHDPADLITQVAGAAYDPRARSPLWDRFLGRVQPDPDVRAFLARLIGYALVGTQTEAVFPVLWGKGANGKSTFVDVVGKMFGSYSCVAEKSLFKAVRNDGHPVDRAVLINKRLARSEELPDVELDEPKIKGLTGGDKITGRGMRENFKEWDPTHTFLVHSNTKPRLTGTDDGIWRRLILVPFDVKIPREEDDTLLKWKLERELPGILNWALRGYEDYCTGGLAVPDVLREAVEDYRAESDTVTPFVDRYEAAAGCVSFGVIQDHEDYSTENGLDRDEARKNYKAAARVFSEMGAKTKAAYNPGTGKSQRGWVGLRLREDA